MKKKLNLTELHVKSFVTSMDNPQLEKLKGGSVVIPSCVECQSSILMCGLNP